MLSPDYLLRVSEGGEAIAETLHNEIIKQIVERIAIRLDRGDDYILTARDKWQIEVLRDAGFLREDIEKAIAKYTGLMQTEIAEAMEESGVKAIDYDNEVYKTAGLSPLPLGQSPHLIRIMQRTYEATAGEWINFTRTTADACQQQFIQACDNAYTMVASGASGYGQAFVDTINGIVEKGVEVTYTKYNPDGSIKSVHTDTIETATLRCIRTGVSQATAEITDARMDEMDWDIILVSSHLGARVTDREDFTNHYWWQGKFYSKSGKDDRFPPFSVCGMGHVQGIHGANCRHQHGPGDGEFNPYDQYDSEENRKAYELQQRQRAMERRIRESKRKCMGLKQGLDSATTDEGKELAEKAYQKQAALLKKRNQAYNQFCDDNNLKRRNERIAIAKWDRSQAAKARAAAKKARGMTSTKSEDGKKRGKIGDLPNPNSENINGLIDVTSQYREKAKSSNGSIVLSEGYDKNSHKNEVNVAKIIHGEFGGDIKLLSESSVEGEKTPDYLWNNKFWELKSTSTEKAVDSAIRKGLKQIERNPGGIVLDFSENKIVFEKVQKYIADRMGRRDDIPADIMIIQNGKIIKIVRYKK